MKPQTTVLILDANQRSALAATRSIGAKNIRVITADCSNSALAACSKFSSLYLQYPNPQEAPDEFVNYIAQAVIEYDVTVLLPMTETTVPIVLENADKLNNAHIPLARQEQVASVSNKYELMQLATRLGVPVPATHYIDSLEQILELASTLSYPVVLKPFQSKIWDADSGQWLSGSVTYIHNETDLLSLVNSNPIFSRHPFLVQQLIKGQGQGVFVAYDHGRLVSAFAHKRLREKPPSGGVSVLSESAAPNERMLQLATTLLDHADWHGVAMVEFKVDDAGTPYLMEINTRFWGSLQLAIDAGVDFPFQLYQIAIDAAAKPTAPQPYVIGRRLRWLLGDLDRLYLCFKQRDRGVVEKLRDLAVFLNFFDRNTRLEVLRWHDPKPFIYALKNYF